MIFDLWKFILIAYISKYMGKYIIFFKYKVELFLFIVGNKFFIKLKTPIVDFTNDFC